MNYNFPKFMVSFLPDTKQIFKIQRVKVNMCFSATASFSAALMLLIVGVMNYRVNSNNSFRIFSLMPILFAVQQFTEGMLWLSFRYPALGAFQEVSKYVFLTFAMIIWPVFVHTPS